MKKNTDSFELAQTSMCVWETALEHMNHHAGLGAYLKAARSEVGISELRSAMVPLAELIEQLYADIGDFYHQPFDMDFVPQVMDLTFRLCLHLGVRSNEELTEHTMRIVWVLMNSTVSIPELLGPGCRLYIQNSTTVVSDQGSEIVDYREDANYGEDCTGLGDSFYSLHMVNGAAPAVRLADFPSWKSAEKAMIAILVKCQANASPNASAAA
jgi:hypothetical protein